MEHGIRPVMNRAVRFLAACVLLVTSTVHAVEQRIAVVTGQGSRIKAITAQNVRRAYLGSSIVLDGVEVKPLLNQSDELAKEVFMQKVLFMSDEAYRRLLLTRTFRGGSSVKFYNSFTDLLDVLNNDNSAITFMLYETAIKTPGIRIIDNP